MNTKLTLQLDKSIIEKAKKYASEQDTSLSRLVEAYLHSLTGEQKNDDIEISAFVKSMASGTKIPTGLNPKKEYSNYLDEKYK